ncbi:MAG: PKD domain-containing protein [Thermoplasmata archaeon]|nr:PKD domain-containing protein [Thermoplasmata archaeon]
MKRLQVIVAICVILAAIPTWYLYENAMSEDDEENISPAFIYKVDGYNVFVNGKSSKGTNLNFTWIWGDEPEENATEENATFDHSPMTTHTYNHSLGWEDYTITLMVRNNKKSHDCSVDISVPAYKIGVCPESADTHPTPAYFPIRYICDVSSVGGCPEYLDTPVVDELPNKWAILATCCHEYNTAGGLEADYYPGIRTLKQIGYPEEHFVYLEKFTYTHECIIRALSYVKEMSSDFDNATVVFYIVTHGACTATNSRLQIYEDDTETLQTTDLWDYELRDMLTDFTPDKFLFITCACQSGFLANEDTSGHLYGETADAYENPSMPGRIIVTGSTAPLLTGFTVIGYGFWEQGIGENKGDTAPTGNQDGETSVEEAFFYCKSLANAHGTLTAYSQPCMDDRYSVDDPVSDEMVL